MNLITGITTLVLAASSPSVQQTSEKPGIEYSITVPTKQEVADEFWCRLDEMLKSEGKAEATAVSFKNDTLFVQVYVNEEQFADTVDVPSGIAKAKFRTAYTYELETGDATRTLFLLLGLTSAAGAVFFSGKRLVNGILKKGPNDKKKGGRA